MWQKYFLLTATVILSTFLFTQIQAESFLHPYPLHEKRNLKLCGSQLADMVAVACNGVYNMLKKKSVYDDSDDLYEYDQQPYFEDTRLSFPFRNRQNAAALIPGTFRRSSRGIIDECCKKSCSLAELKTYCAKP